jgi:elongation factor Ts
MAERLAAQGTKQPRPGHLAGPSARPKAIVAIQGVAAMEVSAADVKKLRDRTGSQMMKCKAALVEAGGDMEKAVDILRKQNAATQVKISDRVPTEGRIAVHVDNAAGVGAILELRCETAPVAKNEMFVKLADALARQVAVKEATTPEALLAQPFVDEPARTVNERIGDVVGLMRENVKPARVGRLQGRLGSYVHHDGTVGVLLAVEGTTTDTQVLRDVCMHIAARNPLAALREQIPQERIDKEMEIARSQAQEQGKNKPANIIEKIAEGKLRTWLADNVLSEQPFVKDESKTIGQLLSAAGLKLKGFIRYRVGEVAG